MRLSVDRFERPVNHRTSDSPTKAVYDAEVCFDGAGGKQVNECLALCTRPTAEFLGASRDEYGFLGSMPFRVEPDNLMVRLPG